MVESTHPGLVVANVLRADESSASGHSVSSGAGGQMIVRLADPIDAVVGHARHFRVSAAQRVYVVRPAFGLEQFRTKERRVADDDVGFGPLGRQAVGGDEGVGSNEVLVKVIQRQGRFGDVQLVDRQFAGDHHGDFGDFDCEGLDVEAVEVLGAEEAQHALAGLGAAGEFLHPLKQVSFEALEFAVGDVEEVAGTTGGVENAEIVQAVPQLDQTLEGLGGINLLAPALDDGAADNLDAVGGGGEEG